MKKIKQLVIGFALFIGVGAASISVTPSAMAINVFSACTGNSSSSVCKSTNDSASTMIGTVIQILLTVLGMISVLMIVIGGIRYTTSNGDSSALKGAKDTILYSVVGLVVAIMAYAIVHFVVGYF